MGKGHAGPLHPTDSEHTPWCRLAPGTPHDSPPGADQHHASLRGLGYGCALPHARVNTCSWGCQDDKTKSRKALNPPVTIGPKH